IRAVTKIRSVFFFGSLLNLIARLIDKAGLIKRFDLVFTAGQITSDALRRRTRVKNINYQDYDNYMSARNNKDRLVTGNYCVFLDEGCTNYPYAKILKIKDIDPVMFYAAFNRLFDEVERKFNLRVVIAAHPDIKYDRPVFGDRNIYEGKTCELVRDCQFVIAQSSTSVSFAVFYKKPIIFVYTDEFRAKWKLGFRVMEFHAKELGLTLYNIDLNNDLPAIDVPSVNFGLYDKLKYRCFTSKESENEFSKDIVIRTLKSLQ
ncbi:MAG: hypothetical protein NTY47_03675, partial [Candidatus Omnitrophica bacterium]|nr:hypothetical protein [Candidatus Omnitrophota bacterium]